jgi:predicted DNA-binding transcriptional regulator YafY
MKTERLLEIVLYLLNHETVPARQLADKFHVSVRTIQRDMDNLSLAGIPLRSDVGSRGGYSIDPSYKIRNQFLKPEDFSLIVMALKSLDSAYENSRLESVLEKYRSFEGTNGPSVFLDYSVTKENSGVQVSNKILEEAISRSLQVQFDYRSSAGAASRKTVCPLALRYKWYAWYLFAFDAAKKDYRTYKVARIKNPVMTEIRFEGYDDVQKRLLFSEKDYLKTCETIEVWCSGDSVDAFEEYFPGEKKEKRADGSWIMHLHVPPNEKLWQALLLSLGDQVKILEPASYREQLIRTALSFLSNYDIHVS